MKTAINKKDMPTELVYQKIQPELDVQLANAVRRSDYTTIVSIVLKQLVLSFERTGESAPSTRDTNHDPSLLDSPAREDS